MGHINKQASCCSVCLVFWCLHPIGDEVRLLWWEGHSGGASQAWCQYRSGRVISVPHVLHGRQRKAKAN